MVSFREERRVGMDTTDSCNGDCVVSLGLEHIRWTPPYPNTGIAAHMRRFSFANSSASVSRPHDD